MTTPFPETQVKVAAALSLGYLAARFIMDPETWPVFKAYTKTVGRIGIIAERPEHLEPLVVTLANMMKSPQIHSLLVELIDGGHVPPGFMPKT